ncbi:DUF447 domain-containing protein [Planctomycetaceae bacterium SH139]
MILEAIVTTTNAAGQVNVAPMGPTVDPDLSRFTLKPFRPSTTYDNLKATGRATIHVTDDSLLFARAVTHCLTRLPPLTAVGPNKTSAQQRTAQQRTGPAGNGPAGNGPAGNGETAAAAEVGWWALRDACRYFAVEVTDWQDDDPRAIATCRVVETGEWRPFFGFNRAKHAVIEAAILASRAHFLDRQLIEKQMSELAVLVDKTAGDAEHEAFSLIENYLAGLV